MKAYGVLLTSVTAILAGCGGGGGGDTDRIGDSIVEAVDDYRDIIKENPEGAFITDINASGRQTYRGQVYAHTLSTRMSVAGDFTMEADFDNGVVNGDMRNIVGIDLSQQDAGALIDPAADSVEDYLDNAENIGAGLERNGERYDGTLVIAEGIIFDDGIVNGVINGEITRDSDQETLSVESDFFGGFLDDDGNENEPERFDGGLEGEITNKAGETENFGAAIFSESD